MDRRDDTHELAEPAAEIRPAGPEVGHTGAAWLSRGAKGYNADDTLGNAEQALALALETLRVGRVQVQREAAQLVEMEHRVDLVHLFLWQLIEQDTPFKRNGSYSQRLVDFIDALGGVLGWQPEDLRCKVTQNSEIDRLKGRLLRGHHRS